MDEKGRRRPARYMSIYYDEVQQRYSQPKLELYGVFIAMKAARPLDPWMPIHTRT